MRKEFDLEGKFVIGHVGRFIEEKNHELILKIFGELKKKKSSSFLLLVGDGELENEIKKYLYNIGGQNDFLILSRDHKADEQRYAEGQENGNAVGERSEHQFHFVLARERCQEPLEHAYARGKSDDDADKGHPDVLRNQQFSDGAVAETEYL